MILTLTPNPSLDLLFTAERLVWDDANRVPMPRRRPGGQGINVVRAARALDPAAEARAVAPLGGAVGDEMRRLLDAEGMPFTTIPVPGETRVFVGVRERAGDRALLLNPRGAEAGAETAAAIVGAVLNVMDDSDGSAADGPRWLACCGSLLPGLPADLYALLGKEARRRGWRFVADCDGEALRRAAPTCDLLVPNVHEAERLLGRRIRGAEAAADAATSLVELGPALAVITLGADGAVAATRDGRWHARARPGGAGAESLRADMDEGSAVGAGDAFLAALLLRGSPWLSPADALRDAVTAGAATLLSRGDQLVRATDHRRLLAHVAVDPVPG